MPAELHARHGGVKGGLHVVASGSSLEFSQGTMTRARPGAFFSSLTLPL